MRRHWKKLVLFSVAFVACALFALLAVFARSLTTPRQPSYQGHKLSDWITSQDTNAETAALVQMGTDALPYLVDWACPKQNPRWRRALIQLLQKTTPTRRLSAWLDTDYARAGCARGALGLLRTNAYPALPQLASLIAAAHSPQEASYPQYSTLAILYGNRPTVPYMRTLEQRAFNDPNPTIRQAATNVRPFVNLQAMQEKRIYEQDPTIRPAATNVPDFLDPLPTY